MSVTSEQASKCGIGQKENPASQRVEHGMGVTKKEGSLWTFFECCRSMIPNSLALT